MSTLSAIWTAREANTASRHRLVLLADTMVAHPATTLLCVWVLQMTYLGVLQLAGLPFGFAVWPMGEDRNWLRFMQDSSGLAMVREFWAMNDRNPLSPWWYWAFHWPIVHWDYALYLLRKLVDLLLAASLALLVGRFFRGRGAPIPLLLGFLVLTCNFSNYLEQITWNFLVALSLAILAVYFYVTYLDRAAAEGPLLGASLMLFLAAIATYTLEAGLLLAIAAAAMMRPVVGARQKAASWRRARLLEVACYAVITASFLAIWYTASRTSSTYYALDLALASRNARASIGQILWHRDFAYWIGQAWHDRQVLVLAIPPVTLFLLATWLVLRRASARTMVTLTMVGWMALVLLAIVAPIVGLGSTSATWKPGFRSPMVYQVTGPLLAMVIISMMAIASGGLRGGKLVPAAIGIGFAVAIIVLVPAELEYNKALNIRSAMQQRFARQFARLADERDDISSFLVRYNVDPRSIWGSDALSATYARTITRRSDVSMRLIPWHAQPSPNWRWWKLVIGDDADGVRNTSPESIEWLPYRALLFVDWDGTRLRVPPSVDQGWFDGLDVEWKRGAPVIQRARTEATCPTRFDFSSPPPRGRGWDVPEHQSGRSYAIWMNSRHASLRLRTACRGIVAIRIAVAGYMAEDILDGLTLRINDRPLPITKTRTEDGRVMLSTTALLDPNVEDQTIAFDVPRTMVPAGGARSLAVMFSEIVLMPRGEDVRVSRRGPE